MRVTVDLPDALHQKVKQMASEQGITMRQFIVNAMERHLPAMYLEALAAKRASKQASPEREPIKPA